MSTTKVVALWDFQAGQVEALRAIAPGIEVHRPLEKGEALPAYVREAEVLLISDLTFDLAQAPRLRWVQTASAGVDHLAGHPVMQSQVHLTSASGIHAVPIGEHVLCMMLAWSRQLFATARWRDKRVWRGPGEQYSAVELRGATLGIVGYGSIGRHVARLASAHGMHVLALRRSTGRAEIGGWGEEGVGDPAGELPERMYGPGDLAEMLPECDYVLISLPLTPETRGLIGARELGAMKPGAFLVNVARGRIVDEQALLTALREGPIAGAGLDVFRDEPLPATSPLYGLDNVILTPHVAGNSVRYGERLSRLFGENLARYMRGEPLLNLIDKQRGY